METAVKIGTLTLIDKTGEAKTNYSVENKDFLFGTTLDCSVRLRCESESNYFGVIKINNEKACIYGLNGISIFVNGELVPQEGKVLNKADIICIFDVKFEWQDVQHRTCSRSLPMEKKQDGLIKRFSELIIPPKDKAEEVPDKKQSENLKTEDLVDIEDHSEVTTPKVSKIVYSSASCKIDRSQELRNQVKRLVSTENKKKNTNKKSKTLISETKTKLACGELSAAKKITGTPTKKDSIAAKKSLMTVSPFNMSNVFLPESKVNQDNEVEIIEKSTTNLTEKIMDDELNLNHCNIIGKPCHSTPKPNIELKKKLKNIDHSSVSSSTNFNFDISANEKSMKNVQKKSNPNSMLCESPDHELSIARSDECNVEECALTQCEESGNFNLQITACNLSKIEKKTNSKGHEQSDTNDMLMDSFCASKSTKIENSTPGKRTFVSFNGESESRRNTRRRSSILRKTFEETLCDDETKEKSLTTPEKTADCTLSKMFHESSMDILDPTLDPKVTKNSKSELASISEDNDTCESSFIDKYKMCIVVKNNTPVAKCARNLSYISPPENNRSQEFMDSVVSTPKKSLSDNECSELMSGMSPTKGSTFLEESEEEIVSRKRRSTGFTPFVGTPSNVYRNNRKVSTPFTGSRLNSSEFDSDKSRVRSSERRSTPFKASKTRKSSIRDSLNVHPPILENSSLEQEDEELGNENDSIFKFVTTRRRRRFGENSFAEDNKILEESEVNSDSSTVDDQSSFSESSYEESMTTTSMRMTVNASEVDDAEDLSTKKFCDSNLKSILTPIPKRILIEREKSAKKVTFNLPESPECSINFSRQLELDDEGFTMISDKIDRSIDYDKSDISNSSYSNVDFASISEVSGAVNDSLSVNRSASELSESSMKNESSSVNIPTGVNVRASLLDVSGVEQIETSRKISLDRLKTRRSSSNVNLSGVKELLETPEVSRSGKKRKKSLKLNKIAGVSSLTKNNTSQNDKKPKRLCKSLNLNEVETIVMHQLKNISKVNPSPSKVQVTEEQPQDNDTKNSNRLKTESVVSKQEIPEIVVTESTFIDVKETLNTECKIKEDVEELEKSFAENEPNIESNIDVTNEPKNATIEDNSSFQSSLPNVSQAQSILDEEDEFETSDQYESVFSDEEENEISSVSGKSKLEISSNVENVANEPIQESSASNQLLTSKSASPVKTVNNDFEIVEPTPKQCDSFATPSSKKSVTSNASNSSMRRCRRSSRLHKSVVPSPTENSTHDCSIISAETTMVENKTQGDELEANMHKLFKHVIDELKTNLAEKKSAVYEDEEELAKKLNDSTEGELEIDLTNAVEKEEIGEKLNESVVSNRNNATDVIECVGEIPKIEKESTPKVDDSVGTVLKEPKIDEIEKKLAVKFDDGIQTESELPRDELADTIEISSESSKTEEALAQKLDDSDQNELEKSKHDELETDSVEHMRIEEDITLKLDDSIQVELKESEENEKEVKDVLNNSAQVEFEKSGKDGLKTNSIETVDENSETEEELAQKLDDSIETIDLEDDESLFECPKESMTKLVNEEDNVQEEIVSNFVEDSLEKIDSTNLEAQGISQESNIKDMNLHNDENNVIVENSPDVSPEVQVGINNGTGIDDASEITIEDQSEDETCIPETPPKTAAEDAEQPTIENVSNTLQKDETNIAENSSLVVDKESGSEDLKLKGPGTIAELPENQTKPEKSKEWLANIETCKSMMVQVVGKSTPAKDGFVETSQKDLVEGSRNETIEPVAEVSVGTLENNSAVQAAPDQSTQPIESTTQNAIPDLAKTESRVLTVRLVRSPDPNEKDDHPTKQNLKSKRETDQPKAFEEKVTRSRRKNKETKTTTSYRPCFHCYLCSNLSQSVDKRGRKMNNENLLENNEIQNDKENMYLSEVPVRTNRRKRKLTTAENIVAQPQPISIVKDLRKSRRLKNVENIESVSPPTKQVPPKKERAKRVTKKETKAKLTSDDDECKRCSVVLPILSPEIVNSPVKVDENGKLTVIKEPAVAKKTRVVKAKKPVKNVESVVEIAIVTRQKQTKKVHFEDDSDSSQRSDANQTAENSVKSKPQRKSIRILKSLESEKKPMIRSRVVEEITEPKKTRGTKPIPVEVEKPVTSGRRKRNVDDVDVPVRKSSRKSVVQAAIVYRSTRKSVVEVKPELKPRKSVAAKNIVKSPESEIVSDGSVNDERKNTRSGKRTRNVTCVEPVVEIEIVANPRKTRKTALEKSSISETKVMKNDSAAKVEAKPVSLRKRNLKDHLEPEKNAKKLKIILNSVPEPVQASSSGLNGRKRKQDDVSVAKNVKPSSVKATLSNRSARNKLGPCSFTKSQEDVSSTGKTSVVTSSRKLSTDLKRKGKVSMTFKTSVKAGPSPLNRRVTRSRAKKL